MKIVFTFLAFLLSLQTYSQLLIGKTKSECIITIAEYSKSNSLKSVFTETQAVTTFQISRSTTPYLALTAYFNRDGLCVSQVNRFSCDTCMFYAYQKVLKGKTAKWKKVSENIYESNANKGLILDLPDGEILTYRIRQKP